jgi:hypothetical protein
MMSVYCANLEAVVPKHATSALLALALVLLIPVAVVVGAIMLALILAATALLSVPVLLALLAAAILNVEVWFVERVRRLVKLVGHALRPAKADSRASVVPPLDLAWDESARIVDDELAQELSEQLTVLTNYRLQLVQLTGLVAAVGAAAVAASQGHLPVIWGPIFLAFAWLVVFGGRVLVQNRPETAEILGPLPKDLVARRTLGAHIVLDDPNPLRVTLLQERLRVHAANAVLLDTYRALTRRGLAILVGAVVLLVITAVMEGRAARNDERPASSGFYTTNEPTKAPNSTEARH